MGLSLGRILLTRLPEEPGPGLLVAADRLAASIDTLEGQWKLKHQIRLGEDLRPYDQRLDRAWAAVESSLRRYGVFDPNDVDRQRATELHARLFATGLDFCQLPYVEQHVESARRIDLIEEDDLRGDLEELVGEDFVQELLDAHENYGIVLGITQDRQTQPSVSLTAPLRALTWAISSYALHVLAFADLDPAHNEGPARYALEPIDALRRTMARRASSGGDLEDDEPPAGSPSEPTPIRTTDDSQTTAA